MFHISKQSILESLLMSGIFLGLLLPLRFVFYTYMQHYWIGTVGIYSGIILGLFYLSKKGKLGKIGTIIARRIEKRARSRFTKLIMGQSIFFIYMSTIFIIGVTYADPEATTSAKQDLKTNGITSLQNIVDKPVQITPPMIVASLIILLLPTPITFIIFKIINDFSSGFILAFFTITLIEEIEVLGLMLFFRYHIGKPIPKEL